MPTTVLEKYNTLTDELKIEVNDFIDFLIAKNSESKKCKENNVKATLKEIQNIFKDDKGWNSESEMIEDMRQFRLSRTR